MFQYCFKKLVKVYCGMLCILLFVSLPCRADVNLISIVKLYADSKFDRSASEISVQRLQADAAVASRWRYPQLIAVADRSHAKSVEEAPLNESVIRSSSLASQARVQLSISLPLINSESSNLAKLSELTAQDAMLGRDLELSSAVAEHITLLENVRLARLKKSQVVETGIQIRYRLDQIKEFAKAGTLNPLALRQIEAATLRLRRLQIEQTDEITEIETRLRGQYAEPAKLYAVNELLNMPPLQVLSEVPQAQQCALTVGDNQRRALNEIQTARVRADFALARYKPVFALEANTRLAKNYSSMGKSQGSEIALQVRWPLFDGALKQSLLPKDKIAEIIAAESRLSEIQLLHRQACEVLITQITRYHNELGELENEIQLNDELVNIQSNRLILGVSGSNVFEVVSNEFYGLDVKLRRLQLANMLRRAQWDWRLLSEQLKVRHAKLIVE